MFVFLLTAALVLRQQEAHAVIWGELDDTDQYPFVGLLVTDIGICSGVLIGSTKFLTAAHCVDGAGSATVFFGQAPFTGSLDAVGFVLGIDIHDDYVAAGNGPDVAVLTVFVIGPAPTSFAQLPGAGLLYGATRNRGPLSGRYFATVGYGIDGEFPDTSINLSRQVGDVSLQAVDTGATVGGYAQFSSNNGILSGGACLGDSGGPVFDGDSDTVVALNSFGITVNCTGTGFASRLDVQDVLDFIQP